MTINKQAKLTLVGAGPGDPDLITLKGLKALQHADVVLYDALANPKLLEYAPASATLVNVGKRANQHRFSQEEINQMILSYAFMEGHVVRLKGGDPFVFGRGYEELEFAASYGIQVSYIPGISSSISVPGLENVPLTCRGINESFWVMTATTKNGKLSRDLTLATQSTATIVLLMGIRKLSEIVALFAKAGKSDIPVMIIQNGSLPQQRKVLGTISTITALAQKAQIAAPGIIIIGEVVRLHQVGAKRPTDMTTLTELV